jgi:hypothetical protein
LTLANQSMVRRELCATCGKDCWQCDAEGVGKKERVEGCSACAGTCAPRIMWVGRSSTIRVHTVGEGAAVGEPWHFNEVAKVWEIGLRTNMPKNPKRNRFQWMQGHKVSSSHGSLSTSLQGRGASPGNLTSFDSMHSFDYPPRVPRIRAAAASALNAI